MEDAERALQRAIRLRPGDAVFHLILGHLYFDQDQRDASINQFRRAMECAPENSLAASNLCGAYLHFELWPEANEMCERSLELERNYMALSNLGFLAFAQSNFGEAVSRFEAALELGEGDYVVWGNLGFAYHHMDRREKARSTLSKAVELAEEELLQRPADAWLLVDLGSYHAVLGERERALELLAIAAGSDPVDSSFMASLGEAYEDAGDRDRAVHWFGKALENGLDPGWIQKSPVLRKVEAFSNLAHQHEKGP